LAQQGGRAAETKFVVPPGGDAVVTLNWANVRPSLTEFVELPALQATLGDKRFADSNLVHAADVPAFWMARREVTVDEYRACVHASRCTAAGTESGCNWGAADRGKHPINCVSAKDAEAYAAWIAERTGIPYRLPTTDEWERAARGGGERIYPWGAEPPAARCNTCDQSCGIERFRDESFNDGRPETAPVGAMAYCASSEGVIDLVGNVAEWARVTGSGDTFQVRGGSWAQNGLFLEPALAVARPATDRDPTIGFRLVVSSDALPQAPLPTATAVGTPTSGPQPPAESPAVTIPVSKPAIEQPGGLPE
jgi:formylglycine-generating enzyme required for sulfatase activity